MNWVKAADRELRFAEDREPPSAPGKKSKHETDPKELKFFGDKNPDKGFDRDR